MIVRLAFLTALFLTGCARSHQPTETAPAPIGYWVYQPPDIKSCLIVGAQVLCSTLSKKQIMEMINGNQ